MNLGQPMCDACKELHGSDSFKKFRTGLHDLASKIMNDAISTSPANVELVAAARMIRELHLAVEAETTGQKRQTIPRPGAKQ